MADRSAGDANRRDPATTGRNETNGATTSRADADESGVGEAPDQTPTAPRPRPAYGEYAPEGWSWNPEAERARVGPGTAPSASPGRAAAAIGTPSSARVPGVPHNLGAPGGGASVPTAPAPRPASGRDAELATDQQSYRAGTPTTPGTPPARGRGSDRIVTILLLAVGAFGALALAGSLQQLPSSLRLMGTAFGLEKLEIAGWITTLGNAGAISMLALYAVTLIFSIQRMRAQKLAFFIPLIAAVLAFIILFGLTAITVNAVPELMERLSDPDAASQLLRSIPTQQ